jgi:hypothetical protein
MFQEDLIKSKNKNILFVNDSNKINIFVNLFLSKADKKREKVKQLKFNTVSLFAIDV